MTNTLQPLCRIRMCRRVVNGTLALGILLSPFVTTRAAYAQTFTVLHAFTGMPDGSHPSGGLVSDTAGNLYGNTWGGGDHGDFGTAFKLDTTGNETVLFSFGGRRGDHPWALIGDDLGNLYGTTNQGG
jgi:uncharacterized repeat protein (TIGR03803 family)